MKRRGNRRYYQHHEVLMIRRIRDLLYDQGFTISGARNKLLEIVQIEKEKKRSGVMMLQGVDVFEESDFDESALTDTWSMANVMTDAPQMKQLKRELQEIRQLLL